MELQYAEMRSPLGPLALAVGEPGLCLLEFDTGQDEVQRRVEHWFGPVKLRRARDPGGMVSSLRAYFGGETEALDSLPVDMHGTAFQRDVWAGLRDIPAGTTISYGELARRIGRPTAVRAVGAANGANPVALVVPCHRVIGASGHLTGYGGGMNRKEWLLRHEGAVFGAGAGTGAGQPALPYAD